MGGIERLSEAISADLKGRFPGQRKTLREKLALLVATMLEVRSANLMDLVALLPRRSERLDMRYQWIKRLLANDLVDSDAVMTPFARDLLDRLAGSGRTIVLMIDQTQGDRTPSGGDGGGRGCLSHEQQNIKHIVGLLRRNL